MRTLKQLQKQFKQISTWMLEIEIERLDENLKTIKSAGTTIVDLKVYIRIRDFRKELVALVRNRNGLPMPPENDETAD